MREARFPQELCELDACKELILHTNRLSGRLPARLGDLKALEKLDCWDNFLEGHIPKEFAKLSALIELHLSGNFLSGPIPKEFGRLRNLRALYLHGNKLSGEIPPALGDLKRLQKLVLINNRLTGKIPAELGQLKVIVEINLANNRLSGSIPAELGNLSNLTKLYLWGNNLSGAIPVEIGELLLLEKLDLAQNALLMSGGGIPLSLRNHRNFRRFVFAVPEHGAPIPPWRSKRSVAPALLLGYLDLFTDVGTVLSYRSSGLFPLFVVGLAFIVVPSLLAGGYVLRQEAPWWRGAAAATQLGLLVEALVSIKEESYSHNLVALRVIEPLFQALPQLLLQSYVLLVNREFLALRVVSVVASTFSLATASTAIVAEHPLSQLRWARGVDYPTARLPVPSALLFGTVPYVGSVFVRMGFRMHPQDFVWWFLGYQVMEIISRVLSLVVVSLSLGYYTFLLLAWLWISRTYIARVSILGRVVRERLRFRKLVRFAAAPIMDSVMDRVGAYKLCCFITCLENACFLAVGNAVVTADAEAALVSDRARRIFSVVAILFMGGKIALATAVVVPFKATIEEIVPPVKGELRVQAEPAKRSAAPTPPDTNTRGTPGGFGDGSRGPALPAERGLDIEDIMAVVAPEADVAGGGGGGGDDDDDKHDLESGRGGTGVRSKTGGPADELEREMDEDAARAGGGGRFSKACGLRGSDDDNIAGARSSSRRLHAALPTVEEGGGGQDAHGSRGGDGKTTPTGCEEGKYEEDEKTEDSAPSHGRRW